MRGLSTSMVQRLSADEHHPCFHLGLQGRLPLAAGMSRLHCTEKKPLGDFSLTFLENKEKIACYDLAFLPQVKLK